jgi:N-acyl-D-amino-acid deacylase
MAEFGLLFRDAQVVDGTAQPPFQADVAVEGDHIVEVGRLDGATARREIPAVGRVLCPRFIEVHAHSDLPLLAEPHLQAKLRQGVTTELLGADGLSYAPLSPERLGPDRRTLFIIEVETSSVYTLPVPAPGLPLFAERAWARAGIA